MGLTILLAMTNLLCFLMVAFSLAQPYEEELLSSRAAGECGVSCSGTCSRGTCGVDKHLQCICGGSAPCEAIEVGSKEVCAAAGGCNFHEKCQQDTQHPDRCTCVSISGVHV